jgi:hypothetical protein
VASVIKNPETPLATAHKIAATAKAPPAVDPRVSTETVKATQGAGQGERATMSAPDVKASIDAKMGLSSEESGPRWEGTKRVFPVMTPDEARRHFAVRKEGANG